MNTSGLVLPREGLTGLLVNGEWIAPRLGGTIAIENPCRRTEIACIGSSTADDVDLAVAAAGTAVAPWRSLPARERGTALSRFAERVGQHAEELSRLLAAETGNAIRTQSRGEVASAVDVLRYYGGVATEQKGETIPLGDGLLSYSTREPLGVVGSIIPWNSPVVLAAVKIGMALATGNTLVLKPAEDAPLAVLRMAEFSVGILPNGVLNVATGTGEGAGAPLARHPGVAKVSFTGSTEVGRATLHAIADRIAHVSLELGGKSPCIVYPDSANAATADAVIRAMRFARQGQSCTAGSRLFVHEDVWDDFMPLVIERVEALKLGDALDESSDIGAVINADAYRQIAAMVEEAHTEGARFLTGGVYPDVDAETPLFARAVILTDVRRDSRAARDEIFGPVLVATKWRTEHQLFELANDTCYGLAAYIFTADINCALRAANNIDAGWIQINRADGQLAGMSYGGTKQSGIGSEYSIEGALESYTQRKSITISLAAGSALQQSVSRDQY
jgi:acyl-CoA reductase-like NAD-dependent aldehyde dehydrogenase